MLRHSGKQSLWSSTLLPIYLGSSCDNIVWVIQKGTRVTGHIDPKGGSPCFTLWVGCRVAGNLSELKTAEHTVDKRELLSWPRWKGYRQMLRRDTQGNWALKGWLRLQRNKPKYLTCWVSGIWVRVGGWVSCWTLSAAQELKEDSQKHGNKRKTLSQGIRKDSSGTSRLLVQFQEGEKKSLPVLFWPGWKCQNTTEDLIFLDDKEVQEEQRGWWPSPYSPRCANALRFKAGGIVKNSITLPESKASAFWKPPTSFWTLCNLCI